MDIEEESSPKAPAGAPPWMATMADMMSLLLTFFVLLLSFANMDVVKFRVMLGSVKDAFGVQKDHPGNIEARATSPIQFSNSESTPHLELLQETQQAPRVPRARSLDPAMQQQLEEAVARLDLDRMVETEATSRGIVVRVKGQLLFESGSAELRPESLVFMDEIARLARAFPYQVSIEGHTDDVPIATSRFPTNWHLSSHRAISALRYLMDNGKIDASRLSAAGYGETRPLVANDSPGNRASNRRVEFVYAREEAHPAPSRSPGS